MSFWTLFFACAFLCSACISTQKSQPRQPASLYEFVDEAPAILQKLNTDFAENNCAAFIHQYTSYVYEKPSDYYFPKDAHEEKLLLEKGPEVIKTLLQLRLTLQGKFKTFANPNGECIESTRTAIRYIRYAEEAVMDWLDHKNRRQEKYQGIFATTWPYSMTADANFQFESGDVILMRGQSYISAMIARIGDSDAQFSHLAIVGEDENGEKYLVESLIETGAIKTKLSVFLKKEEIRAVVYRHQDRELAKKAGRYAYQKVAAAKNGIPYDFAMDPDDHTHLFCAEVVMMAYEGASQNQLRLPRYKSSFRKMQKTPLLKDLSMDVSETFSPSDIELEPGFQWMAEWRYVPTLRKTKIQDAIFTAVFEWMENKGYELQPDPVLWAKAQAAYTARQIGLITSKMQKHMRPGIVKTVLSIQKLSEPLEKYMFGIDNKYYAQTGHSKTFKDMLTDLEAFRRRDCETYRNPSLYSRHSSEVEIHHRLRPRTDCQF